MFLLNRALGWLGTRTARATSSDASVTDGLYVSVGFDDYDELEPDPTTEELPSDEAL